MRKKLLTMLLASAMTVSLGACGQTENSQDTAENKTDSSLQTAVSGTETASEGKVSGTLQGYRENGFTIGADLFAPYIYEDENGEMVGVDYDILVAVLTELGVTEIEVKPTAYESVILELNNGSVDCTCDGMYITEERMKQGVYFSDVSYYENDCILIQKDSDITSEEDLADKKMAVCTGSVAANLAEQMLADGRIAALDYYTSNDLTFQAVNSGQADCVLCDCFAAAPAMGADSNLELKYLESYTPQLEDAVAGFGFRTSEKEFVSEFNKVLNEMKTDGRLQEIFDKWNMSSSVFCGVEEGRTENIAE